MNVGAYLIFVGRVYVSFRRNTHKERKEENTSIHLDTTIHRLRPVGKS